MRKIYLYALLFIGIVGIISCSGNKQKKIQTFAEIFIGYLNANQMDSIKMVYPTANFDSISPINMDSIQVIEKDGIYRVIFGGKKWIDVKENEDGTIIVENSKGVAAFPVDKYEIALNTGMLNDSTADTKAVELLRDSVYFNWLNDKALESYNNALEVKVNAGNYNYKPEDYIAGKMDITIKNTLPISLESNQYTIEYTMYQPPISVEDRTGWKGTHRKSGIAVEPGQTVNMTIRDNGKLSNPRAKLKMPLEEYLAKYYKPTGKEYQEYLDSK